MTLGEHFFHFSTHDRLAFPFPAGMSNINVLATKMATRRVVKVGLGAPCDRSRKFLSPKKNFVAKVPLAKVIRDL